MCRTFVACASLWGLASWCGSRRTWAGSDVTEIAATDAMSTDGDPGGEDRRRGLKRAEAQLHERAFLFEDEDTYHSAVDDTIELVRSEVLGMSPMRGTDATD